MYRIRIFCICCLMLALLTGLSACKPELLTQPDRSFQAITSWLDQNKATITYGLPKQDIQMEQALKQGYILVYGEGLPQNNVEHAGQKKLTALRAAEVVAQKKMVFVLSQTGKNGAAHINNYSASITPILRDHEFVSKEYNHELGKAAVLLKYDLGRAQKLVP